MKSELSYLAHNLCEIDKYRVETCCVIGKSHFFLSRFIFIVSNPNNNNIKCQKKGGGAVLWQSSD